MKHFVRETKVLLGVAFLLFSTALTNIANAQCNVTPSFTLSRTCTVPATLSFVNTSTGTGNDTATYHWRFDASGTPFDTTAGVNDTADPQSSIAAGNYTIWLIVNDTSGCKDSVSVSVTINNITSSFSVSNSCGIPSTVTFTNNSTGTGASTAQYKWQVDNNAHFDTTTGTGGTTTSINLPGTYTGRMIIEDEHCPDTSTQTITVTTNAPQVYDQNTALSYNPEWEQCIFFVSQPDTFGIDISSNDTFFTYTIIWGDTAANDTGSTLLPGQSIHHRYTTLGTFTVQIITTNGSCIDTIFGEVVNERAPTAGIIGPPTGGNLGCAPHTVRFVNNSSNVSTGTTFTWDWGDGTSETQPASTYNDTIYHTYTTGVCGGIVTLTASNTCGNSSTTWSPIYINDTDDAEIGIADSTICNPATSHEFINNSVDQYCITPDPKRYYWDFGDGSSVGWTASSANQTHLYASSGAYTVSLLDSNLCGIDTQLFVLNVLRVAVPNAAFDTTEGCDVFTLNATDSSTGTVTSRLWTFGDPTSGSNNTSTITPATHAFSGPGNYTVTLDVTNSCGTTSDTGQITVHAQPASSFTKSSNGCVPLTVTTTNTSVSDFINPAYKWIFGDGDTSVATSPSHTYSSPGTYTMQLVLYDSCGTDTSSQTVLVSTPPSAIFTHVGDSICVGSAFTFNNTSTGATSYNWNFGDGASFSTGASGLLQHSYTDSGVLIVRLIAISAASCRDTAYDTIYSTGAAIANAGISDTIVCAPHNFSFTNTSTYATEFEWVINGSLTSTASTRPDTLISSDSTILDIQFIARNSSSCPDDTVFITAFTTKDPVASFTAAPDSNCGDLISVLTNTTQFGSTYSWDFGNGTSSTQTSDTVSFAPSLLGDTSYNVMMVATNWFGCKDTAYDTVDVLPPPTANFTISNADSCGPLDVVFTNTSAHNGSGSITDLTFDWSLGNGNTPTTQDASSTYVASSTQDSIYNVRLIVTALNGCKDTSDQTVTIYPNPTIAFTLPADGCGPYNHTFTNSSTPNDTGSINIMTFSWNFGDGSTSSAQAPAHTFQPSLTQDTFYTVMLAGLSEHGCADTAYDSIQIYPQPTAAFSHSDTADCGPLSINFTNNSVPNDTGSIAIMTFQWDFDNGTTSTSQNPSANFIASATQDSIYTVQLIAISEHSCRDTLTSNITVYPNPTAAFTASPQDSCGPIGVVFTNNSVPNDTGSIAIMTFQWDFGQGSTSTSQDSSITYAVSLTQDSTYNVELIATSEHGCLDTLTKTVRTYPKPQAAFSMSDTLGCGPLGVTFTNSSVPYDTGSIADMTFSWDFGDGSTSTGQSPVHQFTASPTNDTTYYITLIAFSEHGCTDTAYDSVTVNPNPTAGFNQTHTDSCGPINALFTNTSVHNAGGNFSDLSFQWNLGNGVTAVTTHAGTTYYVSNYQDTVYNVSLVATSGVTGCTDTALSTVKVYPNPTLVYSTTASGCGPVDITFTNSSYPKDTGTIAIMSFYWDFGNGVTTTAVDTTVTYVASTIGDTTYGTMFIAYTEHGCSDTLYDSITVNPDPTADFTISNNDTCGPHTAVFTNTSLLKDGTPLASGTYSWDFGNGSSSSAVHESSTFTASLTTDTIYTVQLITQNGSGCTDTTTQNITIHPNPIPSIDKDTTDGCGPLLVQLINNTVLGNTYFWDFGDGDTSQATAPSHLFPLLSISDTTFVVSMYSVSANGCTSATDTTHVKVRGGPLVSFHPDRDSLCFSDTVQMINTSFAAGSYSWNFGNGNTSNAAAPSDSFLAHPTPGQDTFYAISLIGTSVSGCRDTAYDTVYVKPPTIAQFTQDKTDSCGPLFVTFTNTSVTGNAFSWNFGNGQTSTATDTTMRYTALATQDAEYTVTLIANSTYGCIDTFTSTVKVYPNPLAAFNIDDNAGCGPHNTDFINTSTPYDTGSISIMTFSWNFGDGSATSSSQDPNHTFQPSLTQDTNYTVVLDAYSEHGCFDSVAKNVRVYPAPSASFTPSTDSGCGPLQVVFTNTSIPNDTGDISIMSFAWNFGNGQIGFNQDDTVTFVASATQDTSYVVRLIAFSEHGCADTTYDTIVVHPDAVTNFGTSIPTNGCTPHSVNFTNLSTNANNYSWNFGDGSTSTATDPSHTFNGSLTQDTIFNVTLVAASIHGCLGDTVTRQIIVRPLPVAIFSPLVDTLCKTDVVFFTNSSQGASTFVWDFGDGSATSTSISPSHTFTQNPLNDTTYTIQLIATSTYGCVDTTTAFVTVTGSPLASFSQNKTDSCGPLSVTFTNNSTFSDTYRWKFGNNYTSTAFDTSYTFTAFPTIDALHQVQLIATSRFGCSDTAYDTVTIYPIPLARFTTIDDEGCGPHSTQFINTSVPYDTGSINIMTFNWNFGNGQTSSARNESSTFQPSLTQDTTYYITLEAFSEHGCRDTVVDSVLIHPQPSAAFTQSVDSGCGPLQVVFTNTSIPNDTGDISIMTFEWDFGNGQTSSAVNDTVTFNNAPTNDTAYIIRLIAFSEHSCRDTFYDTVVVRPDPVASFTVNDDEGCNPHTVFFTNTSSNIASSIWEFGDGTSSPTQHPSHTYAGANLVDTTYNVQLRVISAFGCISDTVFDQILVHPTPIASFNPDKDSLCQTGSIFFNNGSSISNGFKWYFGDGDSSTSTSPSHTFTANPNPLADTSYTVRLVSTSFYGCNDTMDTVITIVPHPIASFTLSDADSCGPLNVVFTNTSQFSDNYSWNFGNGRTSTTTDTSMTFAPFATLDAHYDVRLIAASNFGCVDTVIHTVTVYPTPLAAFNIDDNAGCGPHTININNISTPYDTGSIAIMTFQWNFGNGQISNAVHPSVGYLPSETQDTFYTITLGAVSEHGCFDSADATVQVYPAPAASFTPSNDSGCGPLTVTFLNTSIPNDTGNISMMTFFWDFGNGKTSTKVNDTITFYASATQDTHYIVRLIGVSEHGCVDTTYDTIVVHPDPIVGFTTNVTSGCDPALIAFTNTTINGGNFVWEFGDGSNAATISPTHIYQGATLKDTVYTAQLLAISPYSCISDTIYQDITVHPNPIAGFSEDRDSLCQTENILFFNYAQGANSFEWDFGDGTTSNFNSPSHIFQANPITTRDTVYYVTQVAITGFGCRDTIVDSITILAYPIADFTQDKTDSCGPMNVTFTNTSINTFQYEWTFGNSVTSTATDTSISYQAFATLDAHYDVRLISKSVFGCQDTAYSTVTIYPNPSAQFTVSDRNGCAPLGVNFQNFSVPYDTGSINIMTFNWNLGNGQTSTSVNPSTNYQASLTQDSIYYVTLAAFSEHGCTDTAIDSIRIYPKPTASIVPDVDSGCGPLVVPFGNTSTPHDTGSIDIMTFQWEFGNGQATTDQVDTITYLASQTQDTNYSIRLIAISEHSCRDTIFDTVTVHPNPLVSYTTSPDNGCTPLEVTLTNTTLNGNTYFWDLGDGKTTTETDTTNTYMGAILKDTIYTARLASTSIYGCLSDTINKQIVVHPTPQTSFTQSDDSLCQPDNVLFYNTTVGAINYKWYFGDMDSSVLISPLHYFVANPDVDLDTIHHVQLIGTSFFGCTDTFNHDIQVFPAPIAEFTMSEDSGCTDFTVQFNNISRHAANYSWNFGDGVTSNLTNPSHTFVNTTAIDVTYNVTLTATHAEGCFETYTLPVVVHPNPNARFNYTPSDICTGTYQFHNLSVRDDSYHWTMGDGIEYFVDEPLHNFPQSLTQDSLFNVKLVVFTQHGCADSTTDVISIIPEISVFFDPNFTKECEDVTVSLNNTSSSTVNRFVWNFGDGGGSAQENPTYTYTEPGIYSVKLIGLDNYNCRDSFTINNMIEVVEIPQANFAPNPPEVTLPVSTISFTDLSIYSAGLGPDYSWNFGDGNTSTASIPPVTNSYPDSGTYQVTLTVTNDICSTSIVKPVRINYFVPIANFGYGPTTACAEALVQFTDSSQYADSWEWEFSDGGSSTEQNPTHLFINPGSYTVRLRATGPGGVHDTVKTSIITVLPKPIARFAVNPRLNYMPVGYYETFNYSTSDATSFKWYVLDSIGQTAYTSTEFEPSIELTDSGFYDVYLVATNDLGCPDTAVELRHLEMRARGKYIIPSAFTPNADGLNDVYRPEVNGVRDEGYSFEIFNRWGEKMFSTTSKEEGWDGKFKGKYCESDVYVYIVKGIYSHGEHFIDKGTVMLIR